MTMDGCLVCRVPNTACGHPSTATPVDIITTNQGDTMDTERRAYEVTNDRGTTSTFLLNERDARAYGVWVEPEPKAEPKATNPAPKKAPVKKTAARKPANKARTPENK